MTDVVAPLYGDQLRHAELLERFWYLASQLGQLIDATAMQNALLEAVAERPIVIPPGDAPVLDASSFVVPVPPSAGDIAAALAAVLPAPDSATSEALLGVMEELKKLQKRVTAAAAGGGSVGSLTLNAMTQAVKDGVTQAGQPNLVGTWGYRAGVSGTPSAFTGRVIGITAHCTTAGSMTINGGDSIPIPANVSYVWEPLGQLVSPALVFSGTDTYAVEILN